MKHAASRIAVSARRTLPWRGALLAAVALVLAFFVAVWWHEFLAANHPVDANLLVVEGWTWQSPSLLEAAEEFKRRPYRFVVTVGEPIEKAGRAGDHPTSAEGAARRLRDAGVDERHLVMLTVPTVKRHHTYSSAEAVRTWLQRTGMDVSGINVFTIGAHARKSLVLFRRVLGPKIPVGVIAGTEDAYDPRLWWLSPRGVYFVTRKTLGYIYAVLWPFF